MKRSPSEQTGTGSAAAAAAAVAEREAIQWVVRMTSGEARAAERAAFAQWRAQRPEHEAALRLARRLWLGVGQALPPHRVMPARPQWPLLALAASLLLIVGLGWRDGYGLASARLCRHTE